MLTGNWGLALRARRHRSLAVRRFELGNLEPKAAINTIMFSLAFVLGLSTIVPPEVFTSAALAVLVDLSPPCLPIHR